MESVAEDAVEKVLARYAGLLPDEAKDAQDDEGDFLTAQEAADVLKISKTTIGKWRKEGYLPSYRIGSLYRFKRSELLELLNQAD
jgi:excisionase family DNA binding protein